MNRYVPKMLAAAAVGLGIFGAGLLPSGQASATTNGTYYVNGTTGSNSNACTSVASPCKTITSAITKSNGVTGALTIFVAAGTYDEPIGLGDGDATSTTLIGAGASTTTVANSDGSVLGENDGATMTVSGVTFNGDGNNIYGTATFLNDVFTGATDGDAISFIPSGSGTLTLDGSTITNNGGTGALAESSESGAATVKIINSTIADNPSATDSTLLFEGSSTNSVSVSIDASTIANNTTNGVAIGTEKQAAPFSVTVTDSIVAGNSNGSDEADCDSDVTDGGHNLSVTGGGCPFVAASDINVASAEHAFLAANVGNHGGPTPTLQIGAEVPSLTSPAIGAGTCLPGGTALTTDQRGAARPHVDGQLPGKNGTCDMGAYEYAPPVVTAVSPESGSVAGHTLVHVSGTGFNLTSAVKFGSVPATGLIVQSDGSLTVNAPSGRGLVDVTVTNPDGVSKITAADQYSYTSGYWEVGSDGSVYPFGGAVNAGDLPALAVHVSNIVGLVPSPDAKGYLLVGSDGGIFAFGDAVFEGSLPGLGVHVSNIVGVVPSPDYKGYLMIGSDGGTFAFGDAVYEGSLPGLAVHVSNIVAVVPSPSGLGYLMIGSDGGTFAFGDVKFYGSLPGLAVSVNNIVGAVPSPDFKGYLMIGSDGGTFAFGDAVYEGSLPGLAVHVSNIVAVDSSSTGLGYLMAGSDGGVFAFGDAAYAGSVPASGVHVNNIVSIVSP